MCKFTPMEFETTLVWLRIRSLALCKFTPMEFETFSSVDNIPYLTRVNLLRWSLKLIWFIGLIGLVGV